MIAHAAVRDRRWPRLLWGVLAAGAALRLAQFAANRSFWLDEAMLALNVVGRPASRLLARLDFAQTVPPAFLLALEGAVAALGPSELAFRLLPLVSSILLLPAVWLAARRFVAPGAALFATAIVALSPILLRYSSELKPYGSDALASVLLVGLAAWCLDAPNDGRRWRWLLAAGAAAPWFSLPVMFVLAAAGAALLYAALRGAVSWGRVLATGGAWAVSGGVLYAAALRHSSGDPYLRWYFEGSFLAPDAPDVARRAIAATIGVISGAFYDRALVAPELPALRFVLVGAALALITAGAVALLRRAGLARVILLAAPPAVAALASAARAYPVTARTLSFAMPLLAVLLAAGAWAVTVWIPRARLVLAAIFLVPAAYHDVAETADPSSARDAARAVVRRVEREAAGTGAVYVAASAIPQWLFYSTDWRRPDSSRVTFYRLNARSPDGPALQSAPSRRRAVRTDEGATLSYRAAHHVELLGLYPGVDGRDVPPASAVADPAGPDSGWTEVEAARIRRAATGCAHLLGAASELAMLGAELRRAGARVDPFPEGDPRGGVQGARVCFTRAALSAR